MIAPLVVHIDPTKPSLPIIVYGVVALAAAIQVNLNCALASLEVFMIVVLLQSVLLWPETAHLKQIPDSLDEGEALARRGQPVAVSQSEVFEEQTDNVDNDGVT